MTSLLAVAAGILLPLAVGCASPGQPRPPSLNLPGMAEKVTAERVGDRVLLAWTTPADTTDGERVRGPVTAVICVETPMGRCDVVLRSKGGPGGASADVALSPEMTSGDARVLSYRVELQNAKGRSAGGSGAVPVAGGTGPVAVGPLRVSGRREGALVEWDKAPGAAAMELKRTLVATAAGVVAAKEKPAKGPLLPGAKGPAKEVVLRTEGPDAGGVVDGTVVDGATYTYVAQRVQTVTVGGHRLELRSVASPAAVFTYRDTFPARAPVGLVTIPGGGFGEKASIDLSWDANRERDVVGYNVYRSEGAGFRRVNGEAVTAPAYRDLRVEVGHTYTYRVTAVDRRGNESAPGNEVRESLR